LRVVFDTIVVVAGRADAIVTSDQEMLALKQYSGTQILSVREYLESGN
jgi:predicted nucleic acid-binding protein